VTFPNDKLSAISVVGHEVHYEYNFTLLRAIFANLHHPRGHGAESAAASAAAAAGVLSKVAIDSQGKMKVTHMLRVTGSGEEYAGDLASHPLATAGELQQQYAPVQQRLVVAQFALLSRFDDEEEEEDHDNGTEAVPSLGTGF
jgi:hypothetical protein